MNVEPVAEFGTVLIGPTNGYDSHQVRWAPQVTPVRCATWAAVKSLYRY